MNMKEYRLSIIVLLLLAIIVVFNIIGSKVKSVDGDNNDSSSLMNATVVDGKENFQSDQFINIDIPSPLKDVSEQILYRKGYIVSYNKDTKLPVTPIGLHGTLLLNILMAKQDGLEMHGMRIWMCHRHV